MTGFAAISNKLEKNATIQNGEDKSIDISRAILVDVTAFCENPFLTGIQRQLEALMHNKGDRFLLPFCVEGENVVRILPQKFFNLIETFFVSLNDELAEARVYYHGSHRGRNSFYAFIKKYVRLFGILLDADRVFGAAEAIVNTEYVLDERRLDFFTKLFTKYNYKSYFIEHDLVFWTLKRHFSKMSEHIGHIKHLRLMRNAENVGAVAREISEDLHRLARRDRSRPTAIITPGGDSLGTHPLTPLPHVLRVAIVGTIEPRKRSNLILDVVKKLNLEIGIEAVFCGTISSLCPPTMTRTFEALEDPFLPIQLMRSPTDAEIRNALLSSTVTVYLSDGEGFGVPPLESLALGVPVIATRDVPSLGVIKSNGLVRLAQNSEQDLTAALRRFADRSYAAEMRKQASTQKVPTWADYACQIFAWVDTTNSANQVTRRAQRNSAAERSLTQELHEFLARGAESPDSEQHSAGEAASLYAKLGLFEYDPDDAQEEDTDTTKSFGRQSHDFCAALAEAYRVFQLFELRTGDTLRYIARALLQRAGSAEDYIEWRRNWPKKEDSFRAFASFYCSEESRAKFPRRPARANQIISNAAPVMTLVLDSQSDDAEFVLSAYAHIVSEIPSEIDFEERLETLASVGPSARHDLLRSLLCSDPAFNRFSDDIETWALLLAALGIETPWWTLGRITAAMLEAAARAEDEDKLPSLAPGRVVWKPHTKRLTTIVSEIAQTMRDGKAAEWLPAMRVGANAERTTNGIFARTGQAGHLAFGPYFRLPTGEYLARFVINVGAEGEPQTRTKTFGVVEAVSEGNVFLGQHDLPLNAKGQLVQDLTFVVTSRERLPIEVRVWTTGALPMTIQSLTVRRQK